MTFYQRKLTDEDLKTIEDHGIDSMFTDVQRRSVGIVNPEVVPIKDEMYLRWQYGNDSRKAVAHE